MGPLNETIDWATVSAGEQRMIKATTSELITNFAGPQPPDLQTIIELIKEFAAQFRVDLDSSRIAEFAEHIIENWDDLMDVSDINLDEPNPEDPNFSKLLKNIPRLPRN